MVSNAHAVLETASVKPAKCCVSAVLYYRFKFKPTLLIFTVTTNYASWKSITSLFLELFGYRNSPPVMTVASSVTPEP